MIRTGKRLVGTSASPASASIAPAPSGRGTSEGRSEGRIPIPDRERIQVDARHLQSRLNNPFSPLHVLRLMCHAPVLGTPFYGSTLYVRSTVPVFTRRMHK